MKKEILISSDGNYHNLVAEIYIDGKYIALVSYDEDDNFFVETPTMNQSNEEIITHKVEYNTFIELLEEAKNSLKWHRIIPSQARFLQLLPIISSLLWLFIESCKSEMRPLLLS